VLTRQLGPLTRAVNSGSGNRALSSRRDFSDVPVISIPGNIHLQCKQSALGYPIGASS